MRKACVSLALLLSIFILGGNKHAFGQGYLTATGTPTFATTSPIPNGLINVSNGNLHLEIPIADYKQRGRQDASQVLVYDSRIWRINEPEAGELDWQPNNFRAVGGAYGGWLIGEPQVIGAPYGASYESVYSSCGTQYSLFTLTDRHLTTHTFPITTCQASPTLGGDDSPTGSGYATDGSGFYATVANYTQLTVFDKTGNQVYPNLMDPNGNYTSRDSNGNLIDTDGRTPVIQTTSGNQVYLDVLQVGGSRARYTINMETINVMTAFNEQDVTEYSGTLSVVQSIDLPDGSSYSFTYDSGTTAGHYGEMTGMTIPTGANISFGWTNWKDSFQNQNEWLTSVATPDGTTTYTPTVLSTCSANGTGCQEQVSVKKPSGDVVQYTQTINDGAWNTETQYYSSGGSAVALAITTTYDFTHSCDPSICNGAQWIHAATNTVVDNEVGGPLTAVTQYGFSTPWTGQPASVQEWDYFTGSQPSTPSRQTNYTYGYSVNGASLLTETDRLGSGTLFAKTTYTYDEGSPATTSNLPNHQSVSGSRGDLTTITHFPSVNGAGIPEHYRYDDAGALLSYQDGNGNVTGYQYDASDTYATKTTFPTTSDGVAQFTQAAYDASTGYVLSSTDENQESTTYGHDALSRLSDVTQPDGGTSGYSYPSANEIDVVTAINATTSETENDFFDGMGRPSSQVTSDPAGNTTVTRSYDSNGRLQCMSVPERGAGSPTDGSTCYTYDFYDRVAAIANPDGTRKTFSYYAGSMLTEDELGHVRSVTYDAFGDLTSVQETESSPVWETDYSYDPTGHLASVTQKGGNTSSAQWETRSFGYDAMGRLISERTPEAGTVQYSPDNNGNIVSETDARGETVTYNYDQDNRVSGKSGPGFSYSYTYDVANVGGFQSANPIGRLIQASNGVNASEDFGYDTMGRLASQAECLPSGCTQSNNAISALYNYMGQLSSLMYPDGRQVQFSYDTADHLTQVQSPSNTLFLTNVSYAPPGELLDATLGNGTTVTASYNDRQSLTSLGYSASTGKTLWSRSYTWDKNAVNLLQANDNLSGYGRKLDYDQVNRVTSAQDIAVNVESQSPSRGAVTISGIERSTVVLPTGCHERSCGETIYDSGNIEVTIGGVTSSASFGAGSTPASVAAALATAINGNTSALVTATNSSGNSNVILTTKAEGSGTNYALSVSVSDTESQYFSNPSFSITSCRSTLVGGSGNPAQNLLNEQYSYDPFGNLQMTGNFNFVQSFSTKNQMNGYSYDAAGNLLNDGIGSSYSYDGEGKLTNAGGATFTYDAENQRVRKDGSSGSTEYVYFGGQLLAEHNPNTGTWTDYIGGGGGILAEIPQGGTPLYHLQDPLGSLIGTTDSNQNYSGPNDLTPYGQAFESNAPNSFMFTGLESDSETGTDHATYRQYAPFQARWLSPDPTDASYDFTNPQTLNRYAYVQGQPLAYTDVAGLDDGEGGGGFWPLDWLIAILGISGISPQPFNGSLRPRPSVPGSGIWTETIGLPAGRPLPDPGLAGILGLPSGTGCEFGACTDPGAMNLGPGGPNYQGPPDVAYNGGFLIPVWPLPGVAGIAVGATATYIPKQHLLCVGPQVGIEAAKQVSFGALFSSARQMVSIARHWGFNFSVISPFFIGGQAAVAPDGKTLPAGGPTVGIPGASGSISYSGCFNVE